MTTIVIAGLNNAPLAAARLVLPITALNLGAGTLFVGIMASLFTVAPMLLSVLFGRWVDRRGTLTPFLLASMLIPLAIALYLVAPYANTLLIVASLIGAGAVFCHVAATRAVAGVGNYLERTRNIGYLVVAYSGFQFLGPMIAGASLEYSGNTASVLAIGGFSTLSVALLATGHHRCARDSAPKPRSGPSGGALALFRTPALRNKIIVSGTIASAMTGLFLAIFYAWVDSSIYNSLFISTDIPHRIIMAVQIVTVMFVAAALDGVTGNGWPYFALAYAANRAMTGLLYWRARTIQGAATGLAYERGRNFFVIAAVLAVSAFLPRPLAYWLFGAGVVAIQLQYMLPRIGTLRFERFVPRLGHISERFASSC